MIPSRRSPSVTVAVAVALASGVTAAEDRDAARRYFHRASDLFEAGEYRAAYEEYERAYAAAPLPDFIFNMAQCQRSLGDHERARDLYRRYLSTDPPPDKRAVAEGLLSEVEARIADPTPVPAEVQVTAGPRSAPPPAPRRPVQRPSTGERSDHDGSRPGNWRLAWVLTAAAAAVLGAGSAYFAIEVGRAQDALDDPALDCSLELGRCLEIADAGREASVLRNVSLAAGALALLGAAVLLVVDLSSKGGMQRELAAAPEGWTW